jgi:cytoskeleton protein RodZ
VSPDAGLSVMSDFGGKLRLARERRGTSLRQISATTKISIAALEALERNDVSKLPGGIFSRSFVRSYATEVGLDPDETVREFLERFQPAPTPTRSPAAHVETVHASVPEEEIAFESQQRIAGVVLKLLLISIPLIVLVLYFTMRTRTGPVSSAASTPPPTVATSSTPPATEPTPAAVPIGTSPTATAVATAGVTGMTLELHTTEECWVRLTADGKRALSRLMKEGEKETVEVQDKVVIEVGNAGGFGFSINGRPGKSLGGPGTVRTVIITKDTLPQFLQ